MRMAYNVHTNLIEEKANEMIINKYNYKELNK